MGQIRLAQAQSRLSIPDPLFDYFVTVNDYIELLDDFRMRECPTAKNPALQKTIEKIHRILLLVTDDLIRNLRGQIRIMPAFIAHLQRQRNLGHYDTSEEANAFRFRQASLAVQYDMLKLVWNTTFEQIELLTREMNPPASIKNFGKAIHKL